MELYTLLNDLPEISKAFLAVFRLFYKFYWYLNEFYIDFEKFMIWLKDASDFFYYFLPVPPAGDLLLNVT